MKVIYFLLVVSVNIWAMSVSGGGTHTCAISSTGSLYCWGMNDAGQLGLGRKENAAIPEKVPLGQGVVPLSVTCGRSHSCALLVEGPRRAIKCWGNNKFGQLGLGVSSASVGTLPTEGVEKLPWVDLGESVPISIAAGAFHTCAVLKGNLIKCWGSNEKGELGLGVPAIAIGTAKNEMGSSLTYVNLGNKEQVEKLALGSNFSCALLQSNRIKCWGNSVGLLSGSPKDVGKLPESMGGNLPSLDLGSSDKIKDISAGHSHACVLFENGKVSCWGKNSDGVLALGLSATEIIGDAPEEVGVNLKPAELDSNLPARQLQCGAFHCCATFSNGGLKCWGSNLGGQLGLGDARSRGLSLEELGDNLKFVDLGPKSVLLSLSLGGAHTCVDIVGEGLKCFGSNVFGQLGLGQAIGAVGKSPGQMGELLPTLGLP